MSGNKSARRDRPVNREEYDGIKYHRLAPGICTHPLIRSGRPCIEGTGLKVTDVVAAKKYHKLAPAEIADHFEIQLSMVEDALSYYAAHTDYIDTDIQLDSLNHHQLAEAHYGTRPDALLSRRESVT